MITTSSESTGFAVRMIDAVTALFVSTAVCGDLRRLSVPVSVLVACWLDPSHSGINLGFPQNA